MKTVNQKILLAFLEDEELPAEEPTEDQAPRQEFEIGQHVKMRLDRWTTDKLFKRFSAGDIGVVKGDQPDIVAPAYQNSPPSTKHLVLVELGGKVFKVLPEEIEVVPDGNLLELRQTEAPVEDEADPFSDVVDESGEEDEAFEDDDFAEEVDELVDESDLETDSEGEIEDPEEAVDDGLEDVDEEDEDEDDFEENEDGENAKRYLRFMS